MMFGWEIAEEIGTHKVMSFSNKKILNFGNSLTKSLAFTTKKLQLKKYYV